MNYRQFNTRSRSARAPRTAYRPNRRANRRHIGRVIAYLALTPIVTWYAHQKYTNPFKFYPNIVFDYTQGFPQLQIFETNHKDTINRVHILIDHNANQTKRLNIDRPENLSNTKKLDGVITDSLYTFQYGHKTIALALGSKPQQLPFRKIDILVLSSTANANAALWRTTLSPRLTVTFSPLPDSMPDNFKSIIPSEWFQIAEGPYKTLKLEPK